MNLIRDELIRAVRLYPRHFTSYHEGLSYLQEEEFELRMEVYRSKEEKSLNKINMHNEAVQVGAMAARFIYDLFLKDAGKLQTFVAYEEKHYDVIIKNEKQVNVIIDICKLEKNDFFMKRMLYSTNELIENDITCKNCFKIYLNNIKSIKYDGFYFFKKEWEVNK